MQLPFGSGATVFYNYRDLRFSNETPYTFQLYLRLGDRYLAGELRVCTEPDHTCHVFEQNHAFLKSDGVFYRKNTIWRKKLDKSNGNILAAAYYKEFRPGEIYPGKLLRIISKRLENPACAEP